MAVLEKIRVRMGVFITVIIGLALISFIIDANTLRSVTSMFSSKNDVGKINGKSISYEDFVKKQEYYVGIHNILSGGNASLDEQTQDQIRGQVWQDFVTDYALKPQYEKTGVEVSAKELFDMAQGRFISPVLQQDPVFADENGAFSRTKVLSFIQSLSNDPSSPAAQYWKYCEGRMRNTQMLEKYMTMLSQGHYVNSLQRNRSIADHNTTAEISYVIQMLGPVTDSTKIKESDITNYYKKHQKEFEQETSRDIEFVAFNVLPSEEDIRQTAEKMDKIYTEFEEAATADLDKFVSRNSDVAFRKYYYSKGELPAKLDSFAFKATTKEILPIYTIGNTFYTARLINTRTMPDSAQVRHILIQNPDKKAAEHLADSLINVLNKGADFEYIASQFSADPAVKTKGSDLGWIGQGTMLDTCLVLPKNKLITVETPYGIHIVEVTNRTAEKQKVLLAMVEKTANPGKITFQNVYTQANDLATASNNSREQFEKAAAEKGYMITPAYSVVEGQRKIGSFTNANEMARWAYEAKQGDVSSVLTIDNSTFVVAALAATREKGIAPLNQVRAQIVSILQTDNARNQIAQAMKTAAAGATSIEAVAEKLGITVTPASNVSFTGYSIPGIGFEPKLTGAIASAPENTLTGPIKGLNGVYMFVVTERTVGSAYTADDEKQREQYTGVQQDYMNLYPVLQKAANIDDNRGKFF